MIHFLLADDSAVARHELRQLIEPKPSWQVAAEAADGQEAVRRAALHHPDVAPLDVVMPGLDGIWAAQGIKSLSGKR